MWLFENLKARILKGIITWSEMGQQTTQAKEVYCNYNVAYSFRYYTSSVYQLVRGLYSWSIVTSKDTHKEIRTFSSVVKHAFKQYIK